MVSVTPALSSDYTLTPVRDVQDSSCLCANGRKTFSWTMAPSVLGVLNVSVSAAAVQSHAACGNGVVNVPERGRVDTVTRGLLVKAEGTEKEPHLQLVAVSYWRSSDRGGGSTTPPECGGWLC
eukprot:XP_014046716.1 PREDICTED: murinoglobulin-1-like [Salmo salar]